MGSVDGKRAESIVAAVQGPVARFLDRLLRDPEMRDDALSETLLVIVQRCGERRAIRRPLSFAYQVAWNKAREHLRRRGRTDPWSSEAEQCLTVDPRRVTELREWVLAAFESLDAEDRAVLALRHEEGLVQREIAAVLRIPVGSVGVRIQQAEQALRHHLRRTGSGDELPFATVLLPLVFDGRVPVAATTSAAVLGASAGGSPPTAFLVGVMAMKKAMIVCALVAMALVGWWALSDDSPDRSTALVSPSGDAPPAEVAGEQSRAGSRALATDSFKVKDGIEPVDSPPRGSHPTEFSGVVLDARRLPVSGATVTFYSTDESPRVEITDEGGHFTFLARRFAGDRFIGGLLAQHSELGAAISPVHAQAELDVVEIGPLVLSEEHPLEVVVTRDGQPAAGVLLHLAGRMAHPAMSFEAVPLGAHVTDQRGQLSLGPFPAGRFLARAAAGSAAGSVWIDLPVRRSAPATIELLEAAVLEVEVTDARSGRPVEGVWLDLQEGHSLEKNSYFQFLLGHAHVPRTDAQGRARIEGLLPHSRISVRPRAVGYPEPWRWGWKWSVAWQNLQPGVNELQLKITPWRRLSWPIEPGDAPIPPEGATIRLVRAPSSFNVRSPPPEGRIERGHLVVDRWPAEFGGGLAIAPDGSVAQVSARSDRDEGPPIRFRPPLWLEVVVKREGGTAVEGATVQLRESAGGDLHAEGVTDARGVARLGPFSQGGGTVVLKWGDAGPIGGYAAGKPDWSRDPARLDVVLGPEVDVVARVLCDGKLELPAAYEITTTGRSSRPVRPEESPHTGELRFRLHFRANESEIRLNCRAIGYGVQTIRVRRPSEPGPVSMTISLRSGPPVVVRVRVPPDGAYNLVAQKTGGRSWYGAPEIGFTSAHAAEFQGAAAHTLQGLAKGTWRVVDTYSGIATESFSVTEESRGLELKLDLSQTRWLEGQVVAPEGTDLSEARVIRDGTGLSPALTDRGFRRIGSMQGWRVAPDGGFRVRIPGDRGVTVQAWHPRLSPHPQTGTVRGTMFGGPVNLELSAADSAVLRFDRSIPGPVDVRAFRGAPQGKPAWKDSIHPDGDVDRIHLSKVPIGTWTFWIHIAGYLPLVLDGVTVAKGRNDLGFHRLSTGSRISLRFVGGKDKPWVPFTVFAGPFSGPSYVQRASVRQRKRIVLSGFVPGRTQVWIHYGPNGPTRPAPLTVELEPDEEKELIFDLDRRELR